MLLLWLFLATFSPSSPALVLAVPLEKAVWESDHILKVRVVEGQAYFFRDEMPEGKVPCGGVFKAEVIESIKGGFDQITFGVSYNLMLTPGQRYLLFLDERGGLGPEASMLEEGNYADCTNALPDLMARSFFSSKITSFWDIDDGLQTLVDFPNGINLIGHFDDYPSQLDYASYVEALRNIAARQAKMPFKPSDSASSSERPFYFVSWQLEIGPDSEKPGHGLAITEETIKQALAEIVDTPRLVESCRGFDGNDVFSIAPDAQTKPGAELDYWELSCWPSRPNGVLSCSLRMYRGLMPEDPPRLLDIGNLDFETALKLTRLIPADYDHYGTKVPLRRIRRDIDDRLSITFGLCECDLWATVDVADWENPEIELNPGDIRYCY